MEVIEDHSQSSNAAFIRKHAAPGRVGLCGGRDWINKAIRKALRGFYPRLAEMRLLDFKVRVLDTAKGTGAVTRVLIDSTDGRRTWSTIGVNENVILAAWTALEDSLVYGLLHADD